MPNMLSIWEKLTGADVRIDQTRCVKVRNRNAGCLLCADACTSGCISYRDNEIVLAPEKCIGCGTCATACPTDALSPTKPSDAELHRACLDAARANGAVAVIACTRLLDAADGLYDAGKVAAVPCLGRVDETLVCHLAASGATGVVLVCGSCESCDYRRGIEVAARVCESANVLLETWNAPVRAAIKRKLPGSVRAQRDLPYDPGRRAFFLNARDEAKDVAETVTGAVIEDTFDLREEQPSRFVHVDERNTLPHAVSARRALLASCLDALSARYGGPADVMIDTRLWSEVLIDLDACSGCRMCATFCPTGANFKFSTKGGRIGVKHRVGQCANCRMCADICPQRALTYSEEVFASDVAGGVTERFVMPDPTTALNRTDSMYRALRPHFKDQGKFVVEYGESKRM